MTAAIKTSPSATWMQRSYSQQPLPLGIKTVDSADGDPEAATQPLGGDLASARKQLSQVHEERASHAQLPKTYSTRSQDLAIRGDGVYYLSCNVVCLTFFLLLTLRACVNSLLNLPLPVFPGHPVNCWLSTSLQLEVHSGHTMAGLFGSHITEICTKLSNSGCVGDSENLGSYFQIIHS